MAVLKNTNSRNSKNKTQSSRCYILCKQHILDFLKHYSILQDCLHLAQKLNVVKWADLLHWIASLPFTAFGFVLRQYHTLVPLFFPIRGLMEQSCLSVALVLHPFLPVYSQNTKSDHMVTFARVNKLYWLEVIY